MALSGYVGHQGQYASVWPGNTMTCWRLSDGTAVARTDLRKDYLRLALQPLFTFGTWTVLISHTLSTADCHLMHRR